MDLVAGWLFDIEAVLLLVVVERAIHEEALWAHAIAAECRHLESSAGQASLYCSTWKMLFPATGEIHEPAATI